MTLELIFAWYDLWVGAYWDRVHRRLYVLPVPCVGFVFQFAKPIRKIITKGPAELGVQFDENGRVTHVMTSDIPSKFVRYRKA